MLAGKYNMVCEQGSTFVRHVDIRVPSEADPDNEELMTNYNLAGHTARMQVRRTVDTATPMLTLTTENGGLAINVNTARITVTATATQTAALTTNGVYDIEIINSSGIVSRVLQGEFLLSREVTR